ncbi:MAG: hypothetical protein WBQ72_23015 [Terriglobales bacterium]
MSATRSKLILDEQSFQDLLAAAFTVQQYNERQRVARLVSSAESEGGGTIGEGGEGNTGSSGGEGDRGGAIGSGGGGNGNGGGPYGSGGLYGQAPGSNGDGVSKTAVEVCRTCGAELAAPGAACPVCPSDEFRPGERLQRTWATMWTMSQERNSAAGFPTMDPPALESSDLIDSSPALGMEEAEPGEAFGESASELSARNSESYEWLARSLREDVRQGEGAGARDGGEATEAADTGAEAARRQSVWVRLRYRRSDLYLALAIAVAVVALLWPSAMSPHSRLRPWERVLVAVGIAEAPSSTIQYHGDPNIKVWVDPHAALYYCGGDELYGKSPDGYFTTQHEAQLDNFEPAERSACVP